MNEPRLLAALIALASLGGCQQSATMPQPPLAGAALGGPFTLTDQDGRSLSDHDFAGRYRVMYFGYTYCPDVCPTTLQVLMRAKRAFATKHPDADRRLAAVFVSVDPARDTPAVMKQYVAAFGPGLIGLTGTPDAIAKVAKEYGVYYRAEKATGAGGYLVDHSSAPMLFGPDGAPIAILPTDQGADATAKELATWVR